MNKLLLYSTVIFSLAGFQGASLNQISAVQSTESSVKTDEILNKNIHEKLSSGYFTKGYEQVTVSVINGDVTLGGSVRAQSDKDKVDKEVRNMEGVRSLTSNIKVVEPSNTPVNKYPQDSFGTAADQQLNLKIRDKISGYLWDSYPDVALYTSNGEVTLKGFVSKAKDQQSLMNEILKVEGVKTVKTDLQVKDVK